MLQITLAECIQATTDGVFNTNKLNLSSPLSTDDFSLIAEYLRTVPLKSIYCTLEITEENSAGLVCLAKAISEKNNLEKLHFEVSELFFDRYLPNVPILNIYDNYRMNKLNNSIINAVVMMTEDKPKVEHLNINIEQVNSLASNSQTKELARNLRNAPLISCEIAMGMEKGSQFPVIYTRKNEPNTTLSSVKLLSSIYGTDLLNHLKSATALKILVLDKLQLETKDLTTLNRIFTSNPNLDYFALTKTNLGQLDSDLFFQSLKGCANLKILDLSDSNLNLLNVSALCAYLSSPECTLTELDLSHNTFMGNDLHKIAEALTSNQSIEKLIVDENYIEDKGLTSLINLCKENKNIKTLSISKVCRDKPSDETIGQLATLISSPECQLKQIDFYQSISANQLQMLTKAITSNRTLSSVHLNYTMPNNVQGVLCQTEIEGHLNNPQPTTTASSAHSLDNNDEDDVLTISSSSLDTPLTPLSEHDAVHEEVASSTPAFA